MPEFPKYLFVFRSINLGASEAVKFELLTSYQNKPVTPHCMLDMGLGEEQFLLRYCFYSGPPKFCFLFFVFNTLSWNGFIRTFIIETS